MMQLRRSRFGLIVGAAVSMIAALAQSQAHAQTQAQAEEEKFVQDEIYSDEELRVYTEFQKFFQFDDDDGGYPNEVENYLVKSNEMFESGVPQVGLKVFRDAVDACKRIKGESSSTVALLMTGGMMIGAVMEQREAGLEYINEGLLIVRKKLGDKHPLVAVAYCYLALVEFAAKNTREFNNYSRRCLDVCYEIFGKDGYMTKEFENCFLGLAETRPSPKK